MFFLSHCEAAVIVLKQLVCLCAVVQRGLAGHRLTTVDCKHMLSLAELSLELLPKAKMLSPSEN